jgi:RimJ/RimL family protein N-acetyltransferase
MLPFLGVTVPGDLMLETERLTLRRFIDTDTDAELLVELDSDPEVMRYIGPHRPSAAEYHQRIRAQAHCDAPGRGWGAAFEGATGQFAGWFFLRPAVEYKFAAEASWTCESDWELGYRLRRAAWGRGLATEAAAALVRLALDDPAVTAVVAAALLPNRASWRVMEKVGMVRVREFAIPGFDAPAVAYATCREACRPEWDA